jgi:hypothetical protein
LFFSKLKALLRKAVERTVSEPQDRKTFENYQAPKVDKLLQA